MRGLITGTSLLWILGTAGASDAGTIDAVQAFSQGSVGLLLLAAGWLFQDAGPLYGFVRRVLGKRRNSIRTYIERACRPAQRGRRSI